MSAPNSRLDLEHNGLASPNHLELTDLLNNINEDRGATVEGYLYYFGQFVLDPRKRTLFRSDSAVPITSKAFDVLFFLIQNANRLVTKDEILKAVWGDTFVEEGNLTQYISHLRKALGERSEDARLIVTIARKGYQFTGEVTVTEATNSSPRSATKVTEVTAIENTTEANHDFVMNDEENRKPTKLWWKAALVAAVIIVFVGTSYLSRRQLRNIPQPSSGKTMLAVLPFANLTGDPDKEYLADGLTEEMISQLGRLNPEHLGVIARTSVMGYKNKGTSLDQIGRDLSVQYVLESSIRTSGNQIRLTAQLIQMKDQTHLWSQDYNYSAKDILNIEEDVAKAVASEIRLRFGSQQRAELGRPSPANPEAFDAYMQAFYYFQRNSDKDTDMAVKYYERATQLDPTYALAWVGLSRVRNWQANVGIIPAEEGHRVAREAAEKALELNPTLAAAHVQMGRIKQQVDFDWAGADASFQRAIALNSGDPENVRVAAFSAVLLGRPEEGLQRARQAVEMDPLNADSWESLGEIESLMARLDEAAAHIKKALELRSDVWPGPLLLSQIYLLQGRSRDALNELERVQGDNPLRLSQHTLALDAVGQKKEADTALNELITKYQEGGAYQIAQVYAFRNQPDEAFKWLERAYDQRDSGLIETKVDPLLKNLHKEPRYLELLKKLNLL